MVVRYVKSLVKGTTFDISTESDLAKYVTPDTVYMTSNDSVATVAAGVITAVSAGNAIITAMKDADDGVEINLSTIGIDIDYPKSGAKLVGNDYVVEFEDETEIKFSAVTPNHIIRAYAVDSNNDPIEEGIEVVQPTDTTVIVKATSSTVTEATIKLDLINRHSEYVGIIESVSPSYTNIYGDSISQTYTSTNVERGVRIWDSTNKCYRYVQSNTDPDTGEQFVENTPLDPTKFYQKVYSTSIKVSGIKLPDSAEIEIANYYEVVALGEEGNDGEIAITSENVTTDSIRIESWPMDLEFRPNAAKTKFIFDLNSAIPYNYKVKTTYKGKVKNYTLNVLGNRLIISNKPIITDEATRTKAWILNVGEVSAIEFYSNPVVDRNYITYTASDGSVEIFNVGTVKLARFTEIGDYTITASYDNGKGTTTDTTINVTVVDNNDSDDREDPDPSNDVTVTFETNGGSKVNADGYLIIDAGTKIAKPKSKKAGYKLDGWYTDEELTTACDFSKAVNEDTTLYAKWSLVTYNITYNNVEDSEHSNPATYNVTSTTITLGNATRSGYTFGGWFSDSGLTKSVTEITTGSTGDKTFYAKWTKD